VCVCVLRVFTCLAKWGNVRSSRALSGAITCRLRVFVADVPHHSTRRTDLQSRHAGWCVCECAGDCCMWLCVRVRMMDADDMEEFAGTDFDEHIRPQYTFLALEGTGEPMRLDFLVRGRCRCTHTHSHAQTHSRNSLTHSLTRIHRHHSHTHMPHARTNAVCVASAPSHLRRIGSDVVCSSMCVSQGNIDHLSSAWKAIADMRGFEPPLTKIDVG
jgi:hypothetical protein